MSAIALYSIKGGVGKTAAAVNLSFIAAEKTGRTLIIDLDPQGSSTYYFRIKPPKKLSSERLIHGGKKVEKAIKASDYEQLDILPSNISLRNMDIALDDAKKSKKRLRSLVREFESEYTHTFLDCPPNINLESENIFRAADLILVPLIPTPLSLNSFEKLVEFFRDNGLDENLLLPFYSMVDRRKSLHKKTLEQREIAGRPLLPHYIPYSSYVERMGERREPLPAFSKKSEPSRAFYRLWEDIRSRL